MTTNSHEPSAPAPPAWTSVIRITACVAVIVVMTIMFLYFAWVSAVYCYLLIFPPPGWSVGQIVANVVIWAGVMIFAAYLGLNAVRSLTTLLSHFHQRVSSTDNAL